MGSVPSTGGEGGRGGGGRQKEDRRKKNGNNYNETKLNKQNPNEGCVPKRGPACCVCCSSRGAATAADDRHHLACTPAGAPQRFRKRAGSATCRALSRPGRGPGRSREMRGSQPSAGGAQRSGWPVLWPAGPPGSSPGLPARPLAQSSSRPSVPAPPAALDTKM